MRERVVLVEKFVENKGNIDGHSDELFEEFKLVTPKKYVRFFTRRMFEVSLLRVCNSRGGLVKYDSVKDAYTNRKRYVVSFVRV